MKVSAIIFDLDGTIVNDEKIYAQAFRKLLEKYGVKNPPRFPHKRGIGVVDNWKGFRSKYKMKTDKTDNELAYETQQEYKKLFSKVKLRKGFREFIKQVRDSGIKTALATSNSWDVVDIVYNKFNLEGQFDACTTEEELHSNKPDPEIFLLSAEKLNVDPNECLVIEDSSAGVSAAHRAGIKAVGLYRDKKNKDELLEADFLVSNFSKITPGNLLNL